MENDMSKEQLIEAFMAELNPDQANSITLFGSDIQKKMADLTEMILRKLNESEQDTISDELERVGTMLDEIAKGDEQGGIFFLRKTKKLLTEGRYQRSLENVEKLSGLLEQKRMKLLMDCAMLDGILEMNKEHSSLLALRIEALKRKAEQIKSEKSHDKNRQSNLILRLEHKVEELEIGKTVSAQQAAQVQILQNNLSTMADTMQSTLYNVIPLWKGRIIALQGMSQAKRTADTDTRLVTKTLQESLGTLLELQAESESQKNSAETVLSEMGKNTD